MPGDERCCFLALCNNSDQGGGMEKRNVSRVSFHVRSRIRFGDELIDGEVDNLSTHGMFVRTGSDIPGNTAIEATVYLEGSSSSLSIILEGTVVRREGDGIAINFSRMDLDSFIHLKNIVAINRLDEEKVMDEFRRSYRVE